MPHLTERKAAAVWICVSINTKAIGRNKLSVVTDQTSAGFLVLTKKH